MAKKRKKSQKRGLLRTIGGNGSWPVKTLRWLVALVFMGGLAGVLLVGLLYLIIDVPDPNKDFQTQTTHVYYSDGKTKIGSFSNQNRQILESEQIPSVARNAVVAAEDRGFWRNRGIDIRGIVRAARNNAAAGAVTGGGSTITQQYVKILYLTQERSLERKVKEALLSVKIDQQQSKDEIITGYLNTIYFGNGAYGIEVAAQTYFRKSASELTTSEAAFLATVINRPNYFDPYAEGARDRILPRYNYVLTGMVEMGVLSASEAADLKGNLPKFYPLRTDSRFAGPKGHLLELTKRQMQKLEFSDAEIIGGGYRITTTFDKRMQALAVEAVQSGRPAGIPEVHTALVSVEPGTGAVKALYGGPDFVESQLNWATLGTQPGSTFKIFAVIAALEDGYSLSTKLDGRSPMKIGKDTIRNQGDSGGRSYGTVNLKSATEKSVNTAFVDLTDQMEGGAQKILDAAGEAGIPRSTLDKINPVIGVSLGYAPVAPIDMATAYATLAADGNRANWFVVKQVDDSRGNSLYKHNVSTTQTIDPEVAADTLDAMQGVVRSGTGTKARTFCPTAGKTGTATAGPHSNSRVSSSWFVGTTPTLSTAVMFNRGVGNEQLEGYLRPFYGGTYPAQIFRSYMNSVLDQDNCGKFPKAANLRATQGSEVRQENDSDRPKKTPEPTELPKPEPTELPTPEPTPTPTPEPTPTPTPTPTPSLPLPAP